METTMIRRLVTVAFGRIVIGAHFLSDVSCGFALVLALECLAARIAYPDGVQ